jgi:hypothetical protein
VDRAGTSAFVDADAVYRRDVRQPGRRGLAGPLWPRRTDVVQWRTETLHRIALAVAVLARVPAPRFRRAAAALWLVGAAIAGTTVPLAATHQGAASGLGFAAIATALVVLAIATARARAWALVVSYLLLGAQAFGALGSAWELLHGADGNKGHELQTLGVNPTFGIALNLVYSLLALGLFLWALSPAGVRLRLRQIESREGRTVGRRAQPGLSHDARPVSGRRHG